MKTLLLAGLAASALSIAAFTPAQAQGGCGPFGHRGFYGACRPNGYGPGYGYGWHRPMGYGYGYGWHRPGPYGWHHRPWGYHRWG